MMQPYFPLSRPARNAILARDQYTCQHCGKHDKLEVHHITPVVLGGLHVADNLISLCKRCHIQAEKANQIEGFLDDAAVIAQLDAIARDEGISRADVLRRAIRRYLFSLATVPASGSVPEEVAA